MIPEMHLLKDAEERIQAFEICWKANHHKLGLVIGIMTITVMLGILICYLLSIPIPAFPLKVFVWMALVLLILLIPLWQCRHSLQRSMREYLNANGIPLCVDCGYNLTGNVSGVCPECGEQI